MSDNVAAHKASAECDSSLEPHAAESRDRAAAFPGPRAEHFYPVNTDGILLRACPPAPAARFANLRINLKDSEDT